MQEINIKYSSDPIESLVIVSDENTNSKQFLLGLLNGLKRPFAFIDKQLMLKSELAFELGVELQEMGCPMQAVQAGENEKTLETVMNMCSWLIEKGADRDTTLIAIGGGITTDLVGFVASIYKRGVSYVSVPTTLLSQVDAGIGGKTGVNFLSYKNMLGTIKQPMFTYIWSEFLKTLPHRDFLSGVAELLKTFIIDNRTSYYGELVELLKSSDKQVLPSKFIEAAAAVKAGVVSRDPFEKGERRKLNLGHTFAHAIESLAQKSSMDISHGEAVSIGIIMAARLVNTSLAQSLERDFKAIGLPVRCPFSIEEMTTAMKVDKKSEDGKVHFVLPREIGDVFTEKMTIERVLELLK